jgi:hypothetical protein
MGFRGSVLSVDLGKKYGIKFLGDKKNKYIKLKLWWFNVMTKETGEVTSAVLAFLQ